MLKCRNAEKLEESKSTSDEGWGNGLQGKEAFRWPLLKGSACLQLLITLSGLQIQASLVTLQHLAER